MQFLLVHNTYNIQIVIILEKLLWSSAHNYTELGLFIIYGHRETAFVGARKPLPVGYHCHIAGNKYLKVLEYCNF